ncbi:MAG: hypothetical protein CBC10_012855 [Gammaproteobacteria bacterium TMED50]|nr:MAG: hypothetical protein CBC10_012855 [Gammaproteobacteria bacterium TMED50]
MKPAYQLLLAFGVALIVLVTIVLPAEQGMDPLGTGQLLGIKGLASTQTPGAARMDSPYRRFDLTLELAPFESEEVKFLMSASAGLVYSWQASNEVVFDLHAEIDTASDVYTEETRSFDSGRAESRHGQHVAPFDGQHGWFFENRNAEPVTVTLTVAGFFIRARRYQGGYPDDIEVPHVFEMSNVLEIPHVFETIGQEGNKKGGAG